MTNFIALLFPNIVKGASMITSRFFVEVLRDSSGIRRKVAQDVPRPIVAPPRSVGVEKFQGGFLHKFCNKPSNLTQE